jgi:hypothetical protein
MIGKICAFTNVELHQSMEKIVIGEFLTSQSVSNDTFGAMVHRPGTMKQKRYQLCLQIWIFDILRVCEEGNGESHKLITNRRDHDFRYTTGSFVRRGSNVNWGETDVMIKLKFDTISSRAYSGRNLNASGTSNGSGRLGIISDAWA